MSKENTIILASGSPCRADCPRRVGIHFEQHPPDIDESRRKDEHPDDLAVRLAVEKASVIAEKHPGRLVIGSDQVCHLGNRIFGKPIEPNIAIQQLATFSGETVLFSTGLALVRSGSVVFSGIEPTRVQFRQLTATEIERYVALDEPFDCAGSIRIERAGPTLLQSIDTADINALYGLPLLKLLTELRTLGINPLEEQPSSY